jgi:hypothetical protein
MEGKQYVDQVLILYRWQDDSPLGVLKSGQAVLLSAAKECFSVLWD